MISGFTDGICLNHIRCAWTKAGDSGIGYLLWGNLCAFYKKSKNVIVKPK